MKPSDYPATHNATIDALIGALIGARQLAEAASVAIVHDYTEGWGVGREPLLWPLARALGDLALVVQTVDDLHHVLEDRVEIETMHAIDQAYADTMDEFRKQGRR